VPVDHLVSRRQARVRGAGAQRLEAFEDADAPGGWRVKYGYQGANPGKPGLDARTRALGANAAGLAFDIPIEQKSRPGLRGTLRLEARPWS